jgi:Tfp pilus assembly PilM family ATPase
MKLGQVHYHQKNNEIISFPVQELDYDYILILDFIKKYEKQTDIFNFDEK